MKAGSHGRLALVNASGPYCHTDWMWNLIILSDMLFISPFKEINLNSNTSLWTIKCERCIMHREITKDSRLFSCGEDKKVTIYKLTE